MSPSKASPEPEVAYFATQDEWRDWLEKHHADRDEVWVGFFKKGTGKPSVTYPESVDQALCLGWIDGVRYSVDAERYRNRFTPRRPGSNWSTVNIRRVAELTKRDLMHPAGIKAFEARTDAKSGVYSFEQRDEVRLAPAYEEELRANREASEYFEARAPWYRRIAIWWIMSAKREETQRRRLATLIKHSAVHEAIPLLRRPGAQRQDEPT